MPRSEKPSEAFPLRLKEARDIRGLTQTELATKAGLPPSSISHFEAGKRKPSFENLRRLATALEASTDFLLGRVDEIDAVAAANPMYRDFQNLTDADRDLARDFMKMLSQRSGDDDGED